MKSILMFVQNYFNLNVLALFIISSIFLIKLDCKEYKKSGMNNEYMFSLIVAIIYIVSGVAVYFISRIINV